MMEVHSHHSYTELVTTLTSSGRQASVTVYHDEKFGEYTVEVNWSALGSVSPADAREYAELILAAADEANHIAAYAVEADS